MRRFQFLIIALLDGSNRLYTHDLVAFLGLHNFEKGMAKQASLVTYVEERRR
jgi:hypothetical protein